MDILDSIKANSVALSKSGGGGGGSTDKRKRSTRDKIPGGEIESGRRRRHTRRRRDNDDHDGGGGIGGVENVIGGGSSSRSSGGDNNGDPSLNDCVPNDIAFRVRAYLDVLLGATSIEKARLAAARYTSGGGSGNRGFGKNNDLAYRDSLYAVPNIVDAILKYNNIAFSSVILYRTKTELIEPIWYDIDLPNNELRLFANTNSRQFARQMNNYPVVMSSGIIPVERYNPYMPNPIIDNIDIATIHCAVTCDHVAQHIIDEVFDPEPPADGADIHDRFARHGTTLHSMFDITVMGDKCENNNETSRLVTIFDARAKPSVNVNDIFSGLMSN